MNVLYLALGMLTWYEDDNSDLPRQAPLLLIPVALERKSVEQPFHVYWTGDEVGENLSLAMKLKTEFDVDYPEWSPDGEANVESYLRRIAAAVKPIPRWNVEHDAMALGFFSFAKFLMYRDLDPEVWPDDSKPYEHETVCALLDETAGFTPDGCDIGEEDQLDQHLAPAETYHVLDADSTQCLALLDCGRGVDMVIQGPPGTGKSQTITNLISDAVVAGKTRALRLREDGRS